MVVSVACVCYLILYMNMCANIRNLPGRSRGHLEKEGSVPHRAISGC